MLVRITKSFDDKGAPLYPHFYCQECLATLVAQLHQDIENLVHHEN